MKKFKNSSTMAIIAISLAFGITKLVMAATAVSLGTADDFAILAGTGITIGGAVNTSTINGDIGSYSTATITGIGNAVLTGTNHAGDTTTQSAKTALASAYTTAEGQTLPSVTTLTESTTDSFNVTGLTLTPGIYKSPSTLGLTGTLVLNGSATDVWIFQAGSSLTTAGASNITLTGGAQACNVFWQVGSSATLGASSVFKGNILALTSIGLGTGANVEGRVLAQNGTVTLDGSNVISKATCATTPAPTPAPNTSSGGVYSMPWVAPLISVLKVPTPLDLPLGPGPVTYDYSVSNIGVVEMSDVRVVDDKCAPVTYLSGDTNGDSKLDLKEIWKYRCDTTLSQTTTNTVTATGHAFFFTAIDTAEATVIVGSALIPPLIHIVKTPNVFTLPSTGGAVTYTYTVTNPGTEPLSDVSVTDDKCTGLPGRVVGHPGDLNKNNLLESNEVWSFTCQTNLTKTTINTGTAVGHANGLTATDFALATVVVSAPGLPNTGISPDEKGTSWNIVSLLIGLFAISTLITIKRKQTI